MQALRSWPAKLALYAVLVSMALLTAFPFYWMFVLATHDRSTIFRAPPPMWFGTELSANYERLVSTLPFWRNAWNSLYTALMATGTTLFFCSLAGFGFAMYDFKGRDTLFGFLLGTMMVPGLLGIIPYYLIMRWLGWINLPRALYAPGMASAFGIFLMRQYIASAVPADLLDAGRIDGLSEFGLYRRVVVPLIKPAFGTLGIITFVGQWNNFMGALIVLKERTAYTLPLALRSLQGLISTDWGALMLGTALSVLPLLVAFAVGSRRIIEGLTAGALKG
ncbi:MAG: carbohydrate ABC transporter permease [Firmicutes bacterium]|uniref:Carbohydrate ABC transporter permease n=1 Tax=Geochorda subterranea TaxID=3109564 RepID=A0ABZ1BSR6_9FIRM|nr:carbohydrate ABC transporter permease [Limnochorda sp. LNt]NLG69649.1 carbohydrate ABC transporter permease [Bacillota bacterium]WRP15603.1 carbohydrate ABC transporter permease [Limnochorda sp. LNt]